MERLLGLLYDPIPVVRRSASETLIIWASGTAPWPEIESALRQAVNDPDSQTRSNVAKALKQIKASPFSR
jgi:HEAT repeat protein